MGVILQVYRAATVTKSLRLTQLCYCFERKRLQAETTVHSEPFGYISQKIHIDRKQVCCKYVHLYCSVWVVIIIYCRGSLLQIKFLWRKMLNPSVPLPTAFVYPLHLNKRDTDSRGSLPSPSLIISAAVQPSSRTRTPTLRSPSHFNWTDHIGFFMMQATLSSHFLGH